LCRYVKGCKEKLSTVNAYRCKDCAVAGRYTS
jgi:hypothetical protein